MRPERVEIIVEIIGQIAGRLRRPLLWPIGRIALFTARQQAVRAQANADAHFVTPAILLTHNLPLAEFTPERVAGRCGVGAETIRCITRELVAAKSAACYGRIGTTCAEFGTLASWAVDLVNIFSGNLDRKGGAMFTRAAAIPGWKGDRAGGRGVSLHRWTSRVKGLPEIFGELPAATLADEIETAGEGQIRALITIAGNPCVSTQQSERLARALSKLEFMVSIDFYLNETTRWADVILPPTSALEHDTYDLALYRLAVRDFAKYSEAAVEKDPEAQHDSWTATYNNPKLYEWFLAHERK